MNEFELFHEVIRCRRTDVTAYFYPEFVWKQETAIFSEDVSRSVAFIDTDCSDEELFWLSEVFADIAETTQSAAFVESIRARTTRVADPEWREDIRRAVTEAEKRLEK